MDDWRLKFGDLEGKYNSAIRDYESRINDLNNAVRGYENDLNDWRNKYGQLESNYNNLSNQSSN